MTADMTARIIVCSAEAWVAMIGIVASDTELVVWVHCHNPG